MIELFDSLQARLRPEDVAEMIQSGMGHLFTPAEYKILDKAAEQSFKRRLSRASLMMGTFKRPQTPKKQIEKAHELFGQAFSWSLAEWSDPSKIEQLIRALSLLIGKSYGESDFKSNRLNSKQRETGGLDISKRRYNKLFRFLKRFESKLKTYIREQKKYEFTRIGKSRLVVFLPFDQFSADLGTAAFISYYSARCNMRSVFTNQGQQSPYDEIADMLFQRLLRHPNKTNWWAVSFAYPDVAVLDKLDDARRSELLGMWLIKLNDIAQLLEETWKSSKIDRETMIVVRGNDSTTWNNTASAWNRARESYIALMYSLGMQSELDGLCPGKVLRLIAADVAAWYKMSGKELDPDTKVWAEVPLPWEVLSGRADCTRLDIEGICRKHGVDPLKKGWIASPSDRKVERFQPTPELVHGVEISSPELGAVLRKAGWFSGKAAKPLDGVNVVRDEFGSALQANPSGIDLPPNRN